MQKALFEPGTPVFIYRLFQFATVGLLILLIVLYTQGLGNQHVYILGGLTFCLLGLVTWIVSEVGLEETEEEKEKKKE
jgi:hypothetical protein